MLVTRRKTITRRIFTLEVITRIAKEIYNEYEALERRNTSADYKCQVGFEDDSSFEADSPESLDPDRDIAFKRPASVAVRLSHKTFYIDVALHHGITKGTLIVSGEEKWANEVYYRLAELIDALPWHSDFIIRFKPIVSSLFYLAAGRVIFVVSDFLSPLSGSQRAAPIDEALPLIILLREYSQIAYPVLISLAWLMILLGGWAFVHVPLEQYFWSLWPCIDLDFGPEHRKSEKKRRLVIATSLTLVVVPIVTTAIFGFMSK
ncbi:MAG: hypothetical protein FD169_1850 [Bacillota bacterium]|nr:MAG: hypothetical protein FD169_1850 [Bacillota bacterium]